MMEPVMIPKTPEMKEELDKKDKPFVKKLVGKLRKGSNTHAKQADDFAIDVIREATSQLVVRFRLSRLVGWGGRVGGRGRW